MLLSSHMCRPEKQFPVLDQRQTPYKIKLAQTCPGAVSDGAPDLRDGTALGGLIASGPAVLLFPQAVFVFVLVIKMKKKKQQLRGQICS